MNGRFPCVPEVEVPDPFGEAEVPTPAVDDLDAVTVLVMVAEVEIGDAKVIGTTTRCVIPAPHSISR